MSDSCDVPKDAVPEGAVSVGVVPVGAAPEGAVPKDAVPRRRWRKRWLVFLVIVLVLGGWFGRFAYLRMTLRPTPRPEYWQAKLEALDPPGPGAVKWADVSKLLMNCPQLVVPPPVTQGRVGPGGYPLPPTPGAGFVPASPRQPDMSDALAGAWDESRPVIQAAGQLFSSTAFKSGREAMRKAAEAGWWENGISVIPGSMLGSFANYREWARCLVAHSRWAREHEHDEQAMVDDWLTALRLAREVRRSHTLIAELVGTAMDNLVTQEIIVAVREGCVLSDAAGLARQIDAIRGGPAALEKTFEAWRIYGRCYQEYCYVREGGDWIDVSEFAGAAQLAGWGVGGASSSRLWNVASPLFHDYETACRNVERHWALAANGDMRGWADESEAIGEWRTSAGVLDGVFPDDTGIDRAMLILYTGATQVQASLAVLGLAEYRRKAGAYPESLAALVPEFLPRLPIDYADRGVLRYRREGSDCVLYSIGPDGVDDGGICHNARSPQSLDDNPDLVFTKIVRRKENE